ncbi:hypothetical protein ACLOJK_016949 [Asimina triloba]
MAADAGGFLEHVHAAAAIGESSCYSASRDDDHGPRMLVGISQLNHQWPEQEKLDTTSTLQ